MHLANKELVGRYSMGLAVMRAMTRLAKQKNKLTVDEAVESVFEYHKIIQQMFQGAESEYNCNVLGLHHGCKMCVSSKLLNTNWMNWNKYVKSRKLIIGLDNLARSKKCVVCCIDCVPLYKCKRCWTKKKAVYYCSTSCQKFHWRGMNHRKICGQ